MSTPDSSLATRPPSRWWYLLSVLVFMAGFAAMFTFMWPRLMSLGENLIQIVVPGEAEVTLDKPGRYTIFHEYKSIVSGQVFASETVSGLRVTVQSIATRDEVPLEPASVSARYDHGGRSGSSLFTFNVPRSGMYLVSAAYADGRSEPRIVLAVGHGFLGTLLKTIFGALAFAFGGAIVAIIVAVLIWRRRRAASPS